MLLFITAFQEDSEQRGRRRRRIGRWRWEGRTDTNGKWKRGEQKPRRREEWGRATGARGGGVRITQSFLRKERGMNIPILPCSLETAASSFGGKHCLCLFPAWLFAWCIPQLYIQWWEKDDVLAAWQWGLKGRQGRRSQLYSMQRSKATLLYPKLVTISQSLKLPSNNLLAQLLNKTVFKEVEHTERRRSLFWGNSL